MTSSGSTNDDEDQQEEPHNNEDDMWRRSRVKRIMEKIDFTKVNPLKMEASYADEHHRRSFLNSF
jgi:hypothetical protein